MTLAQLDWQPPGLRRINRSEYYKMAEVGIIGADERTELIEGVITTMAPLGPRHSVVSQRLSYLLQGVLGDRYAVRHEGSIILSDFTEPQPDVAIAKGSLDTYTDRHPSPSDIVLVVEVSDATWARDRGEKLPRYAEAGIPEYWIVNLHKAQVEVYSQPSGSEYMQLTIYKPGQSVRVAGANGALIAVSDFLKTT